MKGECFSPAWFQTIHADFLRWFQCTTNFLCEWCAGLWTDEHEEEEKKPEKPKTTEVARGRDVLWK